MKKYTMILLLAVCLTVMGLASCTADPTESPTEETWLCACGVGSAGKFCPECGAEKPVDETTAPGADTTTSVTEPDTAEPAETADETAAETTAETTAEPETATPRYDYMGADVKADVTVEPSQYMGVRLTLPSYLQITDADVRDYIDYVLFQYRTADNGTVHVTDQALRWGDDAYIYYKGVIDGEEFEGGSNWDGTSPYTLGLGSGAFIPGFEEGLVGVIPANATKDNPAEIHVTFPEDYGNELAGKDAVFYVAVEYAVQYTLPAYTRYTVENVLKFEGTKDFYASDAAYLSEFEEYVRTYLESDVAQDVEYEKINALWNHLTEVAVCVNLPQIELDYYYHAYLDEIEYYYDYYKSYGGSSFTEQYPTFDDFARSYMGISEDGDWQAELRKLSEDMVKKDMISHAIAEAEGMETVTEEEFKAELQYWVDYYQGYMTEEEILGRMGEATLRETAFSEKIQKWLLEQAVFTFASAAE